MVLELIHGIHTSFSRRAKSTPPRTTAVLWKIAAVPARRSKACGHSLWALAARADPLVPAPHRDHGRNPQATLFFVRRLDPHPFIQGIARRPEGVGDHELGPIFESEIAPG
jgi:hypothetical protein